MAYNLCTFFLYVVTLLWSLTEGIPLCFQCELGPALDQGKHIGISTIINDRIANMGGGVGYVALAVDISPMVAYYLGNVSKPAPFFSHLNGEGSYEVCVGLTRALRTIKEIWDISCREVGQRHLWKHCLEVSLSRMTFVA